LTRLRINLELIGLFLRLSVRRVLSERIALTSCLFLASLHYFASIQILRGVMNKIGMLAGWSYDEVLFNYGLCAGSYGVAACIASGLWKLDEAIAQGTWDAVVLRPVNPLVYLCAQRMNVLSFVDLAFGVGILLHASSHWNTSAPQFTVNLLLAIIGGTLIRCAFLITAASISFYAERSKQLLDGGSMLIERFSQFPVAILPVALQWVLTYLLPLSWIAYRPTLHIARGDVSFILNPCLISALIGVCLLFAASWLFSHAMNRYRSTGS
jgi:ABC-2 type transport system permease protein